MPRSNEDEAEDWISMGLDFEKRGFFDKAEKAFQKATEVASEYPRAWLYLGVFRKRRNLSGHNDAIKKAKELDPKITIDYSESIPTRKTPQKVSQKSHFRLDRDDQISRRLGRHPDFHQFQEEGSFLLEKQQNNTEPFTQLTELSDILTILGNLEQSEEAVEKALVDNPRSVDAWISQGNLLMKQNRFDEAELAFKKAISLEPTDVRPLVAWGDHLRGMKRYNEAEDTIGKAIEIDSNSPLVWLSYGILKTELNNLDDAEQAFRNAIHLDPNYIHAWSNLGTALIAKQKIFDAEQTLRKASKLDPTSWAIWANLGTCYSIMGNKRKAERMIRKAAILNPTSSFLWHRLCLFQIQNMRTRAASISIEKALEIDPDYTAALDLSKNVDEIIQLLNERKEILIDFLKSIGNPPQEHDEKKFTIMIANDAFIKRDWVLAEDMYWRSIELSPEDPSLKLNLANVLMNIEALEEAEELINALLDVEPEISFSWASLARIKTLQDSFDEAYTASKKALELKSDNDYIWKVHYDICLKSGRSKEAQEAKEQITLLTKKQNA